MYWFVIDLSCEFSNWIFNLSSPAQERYMVHAQGKFSEPNLTRLATLGCNYPIGQLNRDRLKESYFG